MLNYSDFLSKQVILGHSPFMILPETFSLKNMKLVPLQLRMESKLLRCLFNSKVATVTETLAYTSHLGQKRGEVCSSKKHLVFFTKIFFWLCKWSVFTVTQKCFPKIKMIFYHFQMFCSVLFMKIHFCIPFVYLTFTCFFPSLLFLK